MDYLHTKNLHSIWTILIFEASYFTVSQSQLGNEGLCRRRFLDAGQSSGRNILPVCTSSNSVTTGLIYFDFGSVPLQDKSECLCTVTFENDQLNSAVLELFLETRLDGNIVINGLGASLSSDSLVRINSISTTQQVNELRFNVTTTIRPMQACLRLNEATPNTNLFRAQCFQRDNKPSPETTGTGKTDDDSGNDVLIGGVVGGVVFLIIVVILVVVVVCIVKRKQTHKKPGDKEDYYITENAMYNKPDGSLQLSSSNQPSTKYETVDAGEQNKGNDVKKDDDEEYYVTENAMYNRSPSSLQGPSSNNLSLNYEVIGDGSQKYGKDVYAEIDKFRTKVEKETNDAQSKPEDEYNHLNELPKTIVTGNVYSSLGNQNIKEDQGNLYNCSSQSDRQKTEVHDTGNVYNDTQEAT